MDKADKLKCGKNKTGPDSQRVAEWPGEFSIGSSECVFVVAGLNHTPATLQG